MQIVKKAVKRFDVSSMIKKEKYTVQVSLKLPNCSWKLAFEILHTEVGPNIIKLDAMDPSLKLAIKNMKPQGLCSAADASLRIIKSIWQVTQIKQRVNDTGLAAVKKFSCRHSLEYGVYRWKRQIDYCREANDIFHQY